MDFFISKVALSICALMVVAILGGVADRDRFTDPGDEVERILGDLCDATSMALGGGSEGAVLWKVPTLSSGDALVLTLDHGLVICQLGGRSFICEPPCYIHTWRWDGSELNRTTLDGLDGRSDRLTVVSGDCLCMTTVTILLENEPTLTVFASAASR